MSIPKTLYELQPYFYLLVGALSVLSIDVPIGRIAGVVLYCVGAVVWVMRSNYRRKDRRRMPRDPAMMLPEWLYEFTPFIYIGFAIALYAMVQIFPAMIFSLLLLFQGSLMLYQRYRYRNYQWHGLRYH